MLQLWLHDGRDQIVILDTIGSEAHTVAARNRFSMNASGEGFARVAPAGVKLNF